MFVPCFAVSALSSFAITLMGKRELVALLCLLGVLCILCGSWVGLQCAIVLFPNHTVSHFSYAPLIKYKITRKRNVISYSETANVKRIYICISD